MSRWTELIAERFSDRGIVDRDNVYTQLWERHGVGAVAVGEVLKLIEQEYGVPPGLLRPDDDVGLLTDPIRSPTIWERLSYRLKSEDRLSELNYQLGKRSSAGRSSTSIETLLDYVRTWEA